MTHAELQNLCRQPGWSANKGAGLITQESIKRATSRRTKTKSLYNPVQNLPERAGPAKNITHPKEKSKEIVVEQSTKTTQQTAHNLVRCPNITQGTYIVSFVNCYTIIKLANSVIHHGHCYYHSHLCSLSG
jgi:hypothetical protein